MTARQVGARAVIPLFPLGTVLVPGFVLPLHVFEPRYRQLVRDLERLRDWSVAERLVDGAWVPDPAAMPNERMRPLVLRRQLEGVARMVRGE